MRDSIAPKSVKKFKENYRRADSKCFIGPIQSVLKTSSSLKPEPLHHHERVLTVRVIAADLEDVLVPEASVESLRRGI